MEGYAKKKMGGGKIFFGVGAQRNVAGVIGFLRDNLQSKAPGSEEEPGV
jgi:hypothetical protein